MHTTTQTGLPLHVLLALALRLASTRPRGEPKAKKWETSKQNSAPSESGRTMFALPILHGEGGRVGEEEGRKEVEKEEGVWGREKEQGGGGEE